ncbi:branched-chain amino acid aminotransferase [Zalerion maritima]|uniref:Branched-chain-amino-acid aminotransferase n=1 Tax=Zalerion maritima TaxID=339359 RepID=A0AAD5RRS5_9PEZI|nr:branched-chain amino acid aminotransferase [Zalerion maritima]
MAPSATNGQTGDLAGVGISNVPANGNMASQNASHLAPLDMSKIIETRTTAPREVPPEGVIHTFGGESICSDHMMTASWNAKTGWSAPELKPYGPFTLMPTATVLHYATECFEGMKAYRGFDGKLRVFRPERNTARMLMSAKRISLPAFEPEELEKMIERLLEVDGAKWLPRSGTFCYLRPTMIGTQPQLGVQQPKEALLYVIAAYMPTLDTPTGGMKLLTSPDNTVRAWVGGFGYAKVGANYGPSLLATAEATRKGYGQILWLYEKEGYCTEAGASNFFVVWKNKETGRTEIVTAPLDDKLILDGVTRRSVCELARERLGNEADVVERRYTISEVIEAGKEGRLVEAFAAGTAFFVCPVSLIHHKGEDVEFGMGEDGKGGKYTKTLKQWLKDIMYGNEQHPWGVVINEEK